MAQCVRVCLCGCGHGSVCACVFVCQTDPSMFEFKVFPFVLSSVCFSESQVTKSIENYEGWGKKQKGEFRSLSYFNI